MSIEQFRKFIEPLKRKVSMMVGRAVIKAIKDTDGLQLLQLSINAGEVRDDVQRVQEYGFTSVPLPEAEAFVAFLGGNRDHGVVIAVDDRRYRIKGLAEGEVAIYTDEGDKIHFKRGNKIDIETKELTINAADKVTVTTKEATVTASVKADVTSPEITMTASTKITATTPLMAVSGLISCAGIGAGATPQAGKMKVAGAVEATGNVQDSKGTMDAMRTKYNSHVHPENNGAGGNPNTNATSQQMT